MTSRPLEGHGNQAAAQAQSAARHDAAAAAGDPPAAAFAPRADRRDPQGARRQPGARRRRSRPAGPRRRAGRPERRAENARAPDSTSASASASGLRAHVGPTSSARPKDEKLVQDIDWEQFLENRTLQQPLPTHRGGFEELPAHRAEPHEAALARRPPPLAAPDERLHRRPSGASPSWCSATSTTTASSTSRASSARTARSTPDITSTTWRARRPRPGGRPEVLCAMMQEWDPVGVCARDPPASACTCRPRCFGYDDLEIPIIDKHLHNLEKHNYQAIARDLEDRRSRRSTRRSRRSRSSRAARRATSPRPTTRPSPSPPTCTSSRTATSSSSPTTTAACSASTSTNRSPSSS